jgi:hypothetical protein
MPLLVNTAKYTTGLDCTTGLDNSYQLIEEMARLSKKYPKEIGKIINLEKYLTLKHQRI